MINGRCRGRSSLHGKIVVNMAIGREIIYAKQSLTAGKLAVPAFFI